MHGLENQARRASTQGMNLSRSDLDESYQFPSNNGGPSLDTCSTTSSTTSAIISTSSPKFSKVPGSVQILNRANAKKEVSFMIPSTPSPEPTGPSVHVTDERGRSRSPDDVDEDDDQFFDAEEGNNDLPDSDNTLALKKTLHKRTESSISMNESQMGSFVPTSVPPENLPAGTTGGTTMVRQEVVLVLKSYFKVFYLSVLLMCYIQPLMLSSFFLLRNLLLVFQTL